MVPTIYSMISIEPDQTFKVVSSLTKKFYWKTGKHGSEHSELNFRQARKGVIIERIFVLSTKNEPGEFAEIIEEQTRAGIHVYYIFK